MRRRRMSFVVVVAGLLLCSDILAGCRVESDEDEGTRAHAPAHITAGPLGVTLTQEQATNATLRVEALKAVRKRGQARLPGRVLSIHELADAQHSLARALADETAAQAQWKAAQAEAKRLQSLFAAGTNASQKAAEAADAAAAQAKAQLSAAQMALTSTRAQALQAWGERLAGELENGGALAASMLSLRRVPVLVTPGAQVGFSPPTEGTVKGPGSCFAGDRSGVSKPRTRGPGGAHPARFVAVVPRTDGILQGPAWLYAAQSGASALPAGLNVEVLLPHGREVEGVEVPRSAGVWWQGALWVYVERGEHRYDRLLLSSPVPEADGWFVTSPLRAGDRLVTGGAQILLSEELKAQGITGTTDE